ncbi:hypothetical protein [Spirosoma koreense]
MKFKHCLLLSLLLSSLMIGALLSSSLKAQHKALVTAKQHQP